MFFKALFTDKSLIYEDSYIQIGCIRSVSLEWRQATMKLFVGNKSETETITGFNIRTDYENVTIKNADEMLEVPPKEQVEAQVYVSSFVQCCPYITFSYQ